MKSARWASARHAPSVAQEEGGNAGGQDNRSAETALVIAATNVGFDWLEISCSDDAQQLSACN